jgi:hypothetical protein
MLIAPKKKRGDTSTFQNGIREISESGNEKSGGTNTGVSGRVTGVGVL